MSSDPDAPPRPESKRREKTSDAEVISSVKWVWCDRPRVVVRVSPRRVPGPLAAFAGTELAFHRLTTSRPHRASRGVAFLPRCEPTPSSGCFIPGKSPYP